MEKLSKILNESGGPVLLYFSSSTCGPCKSIAPQVDALAEELTLEVVKIDAVEEMELAGMFNVRKVPSFVIVKDKKVVNTLHGNSNMKDIRELLLETV